MSAKMAIQSVSQPGITSSKAMTFKTNEKVIFCLMVRKVLRLSLIRNGNLDKSSPIKVTSAVSKAISVPTTPMAIPTVATAKAGASLTPSPIIATRPKVACKF